jgi:gamma-glutamyltranspeptidase
VLTVERTMNPALIADLEKRGHVINPTSAIAVVQAVGLTADSTGFVGASDQRAGGTALAW